MGLKVWFLETRPQFLTLSVVLGFLGTATGAGPCQREYS
jgi:hypothetical protein